MSELPRHADYRDYLCERARCLLYSLLGASVGSCQRVAHCRGKQLNCHGINSPLLIRMLCNLDAREHWILVNGCYPIDSAFGTDDLEGAFSEITANAGGYMPTPVAALQAFTAAERELALHWHDDCNLRLLESKKRNVPVREAARRGDWFDGMRVPCWWPVPAPDPAEYGGSLVAAQLVRRDVKQEAVGRRVAGGRPMSIRQRHAAAGRL